MNEKYKNKYRIKSTRLQNWDYGWNGAYFVTICTKNRVHYFGKIIRRDAIPCVSLSDIGKSAQKYWYEIPQHFPFVKLGAFVVMPNHIHGIIIIDKTDNDATVVDDATVETQNFASLRQQRQPKNKFGPQSQNLASIIRGYKIGVTKYARNINPGFAWQPRYYDHIIRNQQAFDRIAQYIINNPLKWNNDKFYKNNNDNTVSEPETKYNTGNYTDHF